MLPGSIKELIGRLDPGSLTSFVEGLLSAEAMRLGMPPPALIMSDQLTENDGGLDAVAHDVPSRAGSDPPPLIPSGEVAFQIKATKSKHPGAFDLPKELRKPGPRRILLSGGTYVLVSGQDLNPLQFEGIKKALRDEAKKVMEEGGKEADPKTELWSAHALSQLSQVHGAPAIDIGLVDFVNAESLSEMLHSLHADERVFQPDKAREDAIARVRERAASDDSDPLLMSVYGDAGAGKTRTVAHALDIDGLRDTVICVRGNDGLQLLLTRLRQNKQSRGILFADEISDRDVAEVAKRLGGMDGRWRVISAGTPFTPGWLPEGGRTIVLPPLDPEATRALVVNYAKLPDALARMVAEVAAGFPELAFRLADELRLRPDLDLVRLARLPQPREILERALPDATLRKHLAPVASFSSVGFDEELRYEVEDVARAFGLDVNQIEACTQDEIDRGRFVSKRGRYRLVTPKLVAIWLAADLIENTPGFEALVTALPGPLQDAFAQQLEFFGPASPHLPLALRQVLADDRFRHPELLADAAGHFLRAAAAIVPEEVAEVIKNLLAACTEEQLVQIPRRDLVWTLQILLWWPSTWQSAIESLRVLALHETETWANNATQSFIGAFPLYLSGSELPYEERARWLSRRVEQARPGELTLLGRAAAAGLQVHHARTVVGFRGGGEPRDWNPKSLEEYREARSSAWKILLAVLDRSADQARADLVKAVSGSLRVMYDAGLESAVREALTARSWSLRERAELTAGLRNVLRFEELDEAARIRTEQLHESLLGLDLRERLAVLLHTPPWTLSMDDETTAKPPTRLVELAEELAGLEDGLDLALSTGQEPDQQEARFVLVRLLAEKLGPRLVGDRAHQAQDWNALAAALSLADSHGAGEWATCVLSALADSDPVRVPEMLCFVEPLPERLDLALKLVEGGKAPAMPLGRLLYGARIKDADESILPRVVRAVATDSLESALGLLDQWMESHEASAEIRDLAGELAQHAAEQDVPVMAEFYLARLIRRHVVVGDSLLRVFEARMLNRLGPADDLDTALLDEVFSLRDGATTTVLELVRRPNSHALFSSELALLDRLATATSPERVWEAIKSWPHAQLLWAVHHMEWRGQEPKPLTRLFLVSEQLANLEGEAAVCFFNTLGVVRGPMHLALEGELERAKSWRATLSGTRGEGWVDDLIEHYKIQIEQHRRREEEDYLRYN